MQLVEVHWKKNCLYVKNLKEAESVLLAKVEPGPWGIGNGPKSYWSMTTREARFYSLKKAKKAIEKALGIVLVKKIAFQNMCHTADSTQTSSPSEG